MTEMLKGIPEEETKTIQNTLLTITLLNCFEKISLENIQEVNIFSE